MSSSSNLVKSFYLTRENSEPRIIDSNALSEEKIERLRFLMPSFAPEEQAGQDYEPGEFTGGLDATALDALMGEPFEEMYDEEGNLVSNVIKASYEDEQVDSGYEESAAPVYDGPSPEELIEEARQEIETMRRTAEIEIEGLRAEALEDGRRQGYAEGYDQGVREAEALKASIEEERIRLEQKYEEQIIDLEPQFVHAIASVYEKIFDVDLSEHRSLVTSLIRNTMMQTDSCKNYIIHVSRDDYEYVVANKSELMTDTMSEDTTIDIIEDVTLKAGDCMIETANGIYDCGIGTQLTNLRKRLELLSYRAE